ncbi:hypothetical protein HXX76_012636 [Chlamydomonas incerta]|uniref:Uncharacterized protein n=1 Tax=Chlamydomonas incerta TaxID=51695 RepID=A0A835SUP4_CHLIN|nr:hypothetical protein HXX76_012636 [Chlamydomonas incerta]|eukprot:KAG2427125.1 hypothetical protein HXX76_012636 [Chlamydomonas incerta]
MACTASKAPCGSPPPPAPYIGLASGGGREGGGTGSQDSASNATGAQPQQQLKPTYAVLLNLRNLTADPAALAQVQQGAPLFVTGYPQSSRNSDNGVRQTTVLLVVKLRRDDSVQFSGGPAEVLRPLWTSDRLDAPALEIKVGVVAVTVPALEWTDDDNDGVMDGAAAFQAGAVVSNWLDEATNLRNFVDVCSWGKAQLSPNNADDIYNFGAGYTEVALTGIDLGALGDEAAAQAQDAAVAGAATTPLQGWAVCVGYLLGRMRSTAEAQLRGEGSTFGTDWDYVLFALPEGVKALAARSCATAAVAGGGGGGGGGGVAGDGGTQVDWLVSQVSSVLLIASQLNCRRTGQGDAADVCGSSFAGVGGDTTLVNAAVRGLGGNFGLRQALVPSALAELATQDPSSGLSGADVQCFNGPQSWLLGWAEIATGQDLVWNLDNPAAFASQWFTLQAYGSVRGTLLRLRVLHGAGAARSSVFWVVFRAAASSTANRKVPIKQLFLTGTVRDAVHVYEMSSGRNERIASSPDPIWWGYAPSPLNPYVAAPVREAAMAGPGAGATSDVGTEPPLAWLKVWPEQRMQANRLALTAPVRMCLVWSPDAEGAIAAAAGVAAAAAAAGRTSTAASRPAGAPKPGATSSSTSPAARVFGTAAA